MQNLSSKINNFCTLGEQDKTKEEALTLFCSVQEGLESGSIRAAEKIDGSWQVNQWVKQAILLGFRYGILEEIASGGWSYYDKNTMTVRQLTLNDNIRLVPGGSSIRRGSYVAPGSVIMPPSYINIGSFIDRGSMIDSHVLIGSCAQIGKNVHLSAASQIGGVLEPISAMPVIIEDNVFVGGNCGIFEGIIVEKGAVLGSGVILNASTPVFDNITGKFIKKIADQPLIIPKNSVVVAGSRPVTNGFGSQQRIHIYCPIIIKYRDEKTDRKVILEDILRY